MFTDMVDRPFGCPPDIILDIPVPPSVNRTRRLDVRALRAIDGWKKRADIHLIASGQFRRARQVGQLDRFEVIITLDETRCRQDADNPVKSCVDYLKRIELIPDDGPKHMRRLTVQWGEAPEGCRIVVRPVE